MRLTVLVDNNTFIDEYYRGEPAVSYYIEDRDIRLIFDTGYSDLFIENAQKMGIDLSDVNHIVLSHGHNDHTWGLKPFFKLFKKSLPKVIVHPDAFAEQWEGEKSIGMNISQSALHALSDVVVSKAPYFINDSFIFLGEIPKSFDFECVHEGNDLLDDSALVYKNEKGIFIITGCSHSGISNIVNYAKVVTGENSVLGIIGGLHLMHVDERAKLTTEVLQKERMNFFYPCHCTSLSVKCYMSSRLDLHEVGVGLVIEL
jgi:7,8-dihydropterin-6-yl-methyl-4-(beta-D-ribofuranosyl)aminobenzene 5'-phosphate synthase